MAETRGKNEKQYLVMSDIHGCFEEFIEALKKWKKETQALVVIGDLVDGGKNSYGVISHLMKLQENYDVIVTMGNHDRMFLDMLEGSAGERFFYLRHGGLETINSFVSDEVTENTQKK